MVSSIFEVRIPFTTMAVIIEAIFLPTKKISKDASTFTPYKVTKLTITVQLKSICKFINVLNYFLKTASTLLFSARPASVSLVATGLLSPYASVVTLAPDTPRVESAFATAFARWSESFIL